MPTIDNRKQGKIINYKLASEEGESELYELTFRMARGLLSTVEYFSWMSRHLSLPEDLSDQQSLNDWVDDLREKLMSPFDPLSEVCAKIIDCIKNDDDVQDAFEEFVIGNDAINDHFGSNGVSGKGGPNPPIEVIGNPEEYNELWAQCVQIIEYTDEAIVQLLAVLETQSNNIELIKNSMNSIPMFKFVLDAVPVNSWLEFADYFIDVIGEQYDSGYDETIPTGSKWLLSCELFCRCKGDKTITLQRIWDAISFLLSPYTYLNWDNAQELVESVIGVNDNSEVVCYACFGIMWGTAKLSSFFGLDTVTTKALSIILEIAKNDANNDWESLCPDCGATPNIQFTGTYDPLYNGTPKTFMGNTETGGSIWEITCQDISGVSAAALTMKDSGGVVNTCVYIVAAEGVVSYQHDRTCDGLPQESGSGFGNPSTLYGPNIGFYGTGIITVTFEPA